MADRLDGEKLEILRAWGAGLAASGRDEEMRAAGRAIELLAEEVDALGRDLWHQRAGLSRPPGAAAAATDPGRPGERAGAVPAAVSLVELQVGAQIPAFC